jgi:hypothetical protein
MPNGRLVFNCSSTFSRRTAVELLAGRMLRLPLGPTPLTLQEKQPSVEMILSLELLYGSKPLGPYSCPSPLNPPLLTGVIVEIQCPYNHRLMITFDIIWLEKN